MAGHGAIAAGLMVEPGTVGWLGALAVCAGLAGVVLAYTRELRWRQYSRRTRGMLLGFRLGAVMCLVLALLQPAWRRETKVEQKPVLAVVLDDSQSMGQPSGPEDGNGLSRYERAVDVLRRQVVPAVGGELQLRVYDVEGRQVNVDGLAERPGHDRSPLTQALLRVQQDVRAGGYGYAAPAGGRDDGPRSGSFHATRSGAGTPTDSTGAAPGTLIAGILLLSDGAEVADEPGIEGLEQLRLAVSSVLVAEAEAARAGPADVGIEAVSVNRQARVGNTVQAVIDLVARGPMPSASIPVTVVDGTRVLASRTIEWQEGEPAKRVEVEFTPSRAGDLTLTVQVGEVAGEVNLGNNRQTFAVSVRAKPLTVLFVDGVLRWEGKFVRQALAEDPDINVASSVRTARAGADRGSQGLLLAEQLANVHLVILGDVEASYFSAEEVRALRTWVTDRGGALLVTGGYHSFGAEGFGRSELREILPVEFSAAANPQIEQPFQVKLTEAGMQSSIFHLTGDRVRDTAFYQSLPPLAGCSRIAGVKPAAQVLAVNPAVTAPDGSQGLPVMIVQQVGAGRTMVLAVDTTWRWRTVVGGYTGDTSFYARFWGQLARWMIGADGTAPQQLFVSADRRRYKPGQNVELSVTLRDPLKKGPQSRPAQTQTAADAPTGEAAQRQVSALAIDERGNRLNVPLADLGGGRYRGTIGASRPGRWDLVVSAEPTGPSEAQEADEARAQSQVVTVQVDRPDMETVDTRPNPQWLREVAQRTGGRVLRAEQVGEWVRGLQRRPVEMVSVKAFELWHHPALAAAFLGCLCSEWFLRRRQRLV